VIWRLWGKELGEKASPDDREADIVAWIRTVILIQVVVTNGFIVANTVRHW
jgi:hypothetical protein